MDFKKVCHRDCPGRYPGCGAKCQTYLEFRARNMERYKRNATQVRIGDVLYGSERRQRA